MISGALPSRSTTILEMTTIVEYARMSLSLSLSLRSFFSSSTLLKPVLNQELRLNTCRQSRVLQIKGKETNFSTKPTAVEINSVWLDRLGESCLGSASADERRALFFLIKTKTRTGAKKFRVVDRLGKSAWLLKQLPHPYAARCRELSRLLRVSEATGCGPSGRMEKRRRWRL